MKKIVLVAIAAAAMVFAGNASAWNKPMAKPKHHHTDRTNVRVNNKINNKVNVNVNVRQKVNVRNRTTVVHHQRVDRRHVNVTNKRIDNRSYRTYRNNIATGGNSNVRNSNRQGQKQGQAQGQRQGIYGSGNSSSRSLSAARGGDQRQSQSLTGNNSDSSAVNGGNTVDASDNSVYEAQKRNPVNSAWAAPLTASNDTCMGSTSAGGQGITLGLSFATTWTDKDCIIRKDARFLHNAGRGMVSLSLMCEKETVRRAVARAGTVEEKAACGLTGPVPSPQPVVTSAPVSVVPYATYGDDEVFEPGK